MSLLLWNEGVRNHIPTGVTVEECPEGSLSRLQRAARMGLTTHTASSFSALYGSPGPVSTWPHNASTSVLSEEYPYRTEVRLRRTMFLLSQVSQWLLCILSSSSTVSQSSDQ